MTGMTSPADGQDHWSQVWQDLLKGRALTPSLPVSPLGLQLQSLLENSLQRFMFSRADTLLHDLQACLQPLATALQAEQVVLLLCPQGAHAQPLCILSAQDDSSTQRLQRLALQRDDWCGLLERQQPRLLSAAVARGPDEQLVLQAMACDQVLLLPVGDHHAVSGCMLLGLSDDIAVPDEHERSLLSGFTRLCFLIADRLALMTHLEQRERSLLQTERLARIGSWYDDVLNNRITFTPQAGEIFELSPEVSQVSLETYIAYLHPDDKERVITTLQHSLQRLQPSDMTYRICTPSGRVKMIHGLGEIIVNAEGKAVARVGTVQDITEAHAREQRLQQAARVFESTMEGVVITDPAGLIEAINPAFTTITGYAEDEVRGRSVAMFSPERRQRNVLQDIRSEVQSRGFWRGEIWNRRKNGEVFPQSLTVTTVRDEQQNISHYVAVFADITRQKESEQQLDYLAHHDSLTGLPNRSSLLIKLQRALELASQKRRKVAVITIDLDHFKHINDSLGHPAGDRLLQECARRLRERLRDSDTVVRQGGDEFVVVLENIVSDDQVRRVAEIIQQLFGSAFDVGIGRELFIGASLGITLFPDHGRDVTQLISNADVAMYQAKSKGRNHYQFYTNDLTQAATDRLELGNELRHALQRDDELQLHYQPQVCIRSGRVTGVEALIRWQHEQEGMIQPGRFLPVAEDNGLMPELDSWVLNKACRQLAVWQQQGIAPLILAVNITQPTFVAGGLVERLKALLDIYQLDPSWLELEITEGALLEPTAQVLSTIAGLKALGVMLAVDDFGTGYSSLAYLHRYRVDKLKIDRSFINSVEREEEGRVITSTIINMARGLGLQILAEGVETAPQLEFLRANGCETYQGFYFSRPLPLTELALLLK
ncbi:putative bifunctional diguanylate cyclase/phosphodiesterase [Thalassolituus hydrocarboniclasticus]|uniref:EAL domain-containing protein n=1 Tax=Thalassolituus hydrocarboniclasticus TaxID=2742796 RepID=A0ABY6A839_9GAMM|nr:GGDEF domain-containing phosphodiesterase [Thalassolituus hydrocarboniclasticus]UXD86750.1 EAL domain-containing protein [Thalassolituus hydrocarboniclasticus]